MGKDPEMPADETESGQSDTEQKSKFSDWREWADTEYVPPSSRRYDTFAWVFFIGPVFIACGYLIWKGINESEYALSLIGLVVAIVTVWLLKTGSKRRGFY